MAVSLTQVATAVNAANQNTYTFSAVALGDAAANRVIVLGIALADADGVENITSVTIAGIAATVVRTAIGTNNAAYIYQASVPSGTTGDIVINLDASGANAAIVVWRLLTENPTAFHTASEAGSSTAPSEVIEIPLGGGAVGIASQRNTTANRTWTWTNMGEVTDANIEASISYSSALSTTPGSTTVTATASGSVLESALVLASYQEFAPATRMHQYRLRRAA